MRIAFAALLVVVCGVPAFAGATKGTLACKGMEAFSIEAVREADVMHGRIIAKDGFVLAFAYGHPINEFVPRSRRAEKSGPLTIRTQLKRDFFETTILGGRQRTLNVAADHRKQVQALALAKQFAIAECTFRERR